MVSWLPKVGEALLPNLLGAKASSRLEVLATDLCYYAAFQIQLSQYFVVSALIHRPRAIDPFLGAIGINLQAIASLEVLFGSVSFTIRLLAFLSQASTTEPPAPLPPSPIELERVESPSFLPADISNSARLNILDQHEGT